MCNFEGETGKPL